MVASRCRFILVLVLFLVLSLVCAAGCVLMDPTADGPLPASAVFPLTPGGTVSGLLDTTDLSLTFSGKPDDGGLRLTGEIDPASSIANFEAVSFFRVTVWFLDENGHFLGRYGLFSAPVGSAVTVWHFDQRLSPPPGTYALTFEYSGQAHSAGNDDPGNTWDFWWRPSPSAAGRP